MKNRLQSVAGFFLWISWNAVDSNPADLSDLSLPLISFI